MIWKEAVEKPFWEEDLLHLTDTFSNHDYISSRIITFFKSYVHTDDYLIRIPPPFLFYAKP